MPKPTRCWRPTPEFLNCGLALPHYPLKTLLVFIRQFTNAMKSTFTELPKPMFNQSELCTRSSFHVLQAGTDGAECFGVNRRTLIEHVAPGSPRIAVLRPLPECQFSARFSWLREL